MGGLGVMVGNARKTLRLWCHGATVLDVSSINISGVWDCGSVEVWECGTVSVTGHGGRWFQCPMDNIYDPR